LFCTPASPLPAWWLASVPERGARLARREERAHGQS
jgi:hypothetical protein